MTLQAQNDTLITIFGGSGFLGRHLVRSLAKRHYRIRVAVRRPDLAGHLQPLGNVGQIQPVQANIRVRWSVDRAVEGADHVVNLVGILSPSGRNNFNSVQDFGARAVAEAARAVKARLTHGSARPPQFTLGPDQPGRCIAPGLWTSCIAADSAESGSLRNCAAETW